MDPFEAYLAALPPELSYLRGLALRYGRPTERASFMAIQAGGADDQLKGVWQRLLDRDGDHFDMALAYVKATLAEGAESATALNSFIWAVLPKRG